MKTIGKWFADWHNQAFGCVALLIVVAGYALTPDQKIDRLAHGIMAVGNTSGGQMIYGALAVFFVALIRWALARIPGGGNGPGSGAALLLALAFGSTLTGCGASALQQASVGVSVSLSAIAAVDDVLDADLSQAVAACTDEACVDAEEHERADVAEPLGALTLGVRAVGAGIATAIEVDAGQPLPAIVVDAIRAVLALVDQVEAALVAHGITVPPEVPLVVAALTALVGPAS